MDIALKIPQDKIIQGKTYWDIDIKNGDLAIDKGLETAVYVSLFSWARAKQSDKALADGQTYGWYGDQVLNDGGTHETGSRLWLMQRRKLTRETINDALQYTREALAWLLNDNIAGKIDITQEASVNGIDINIKIYRDGTLAQNISYNTLWEAIANGK